MEKKLNIIKTKIALSNQRHRNCPHCGGMSNNVKRDRAKITDNHIIENCFCGRCHKDFTEFYNIVYGHTEYEVIE